MQNPRDNLDSLEDITPSVDEPESIDYSTFRGTLSNVFEDRNSRLDENIRGLYPPERLSIVSNSFGQPLRFDTVPNINLTSEGGNSSSRPHFDEGTSISTIRRGQIDPPIDRSIRSNNLDHLNWQSQMSSSSSSMMGADNTLNVDIDIEGHLPNVNDSLQEFGELINPFSTPMDSDSSGRYGGNAPQITVSTQPMHASMSSSASATASSSVTPNVLHEQSLNANALNLQSVASAFQKSMSGGLNLHKPLFILDTK